MEYTVDNQKLTEEQFSDLQKDPNIKLKKLSENTYKTLKKLEG